ncbi:hypothetical protein SAMN05421809_2678 [Natronorubrum daqingense]|uniref:Uncharacterized protein n=1 Tax=Natronorubrum daqingense TaxID=588898 RepID=A0A1N7EL79_9EURY|nr:hypothetical protein SAMN05421809_2678 [Natronorubrum daqingense]
MVVKHSRRSHVSYILNTGTEELGHCQQHKNHLLLLMG